MGRSLDTVAISLDWSILPVDGVLGTTTITPQELGRCSLLVCVVHCLGLGVAQGETLVVCSGEGNQHLTGFLASILAASISDLYWV